MRKRTTAAIAGLGLLIAAGSWSANTAAASAHTPQASVTCEAASVSLTSYDRDATAEITLDGDVVHSGKFGGHLVTTYPTTAGPNTHTLVVHVVSKDGAKYGYDDTLTANGCAPVTPPTPPVVEPHVQDYVTCKGGAFVLDNTGSTSDVTYTVNGVDFPVPAGLAVHTDADGVLIQPVDGAYTVTAGERTWTFPAAADCAPTTPPQPADEVHYGTWVDQHGETSCDVDTVATHRTVTVKPYVLVDGVWVVSTDESTWTVTDEESTRPKTAEEIKACESTTPPTEEPTTPPTGEPTIPAPSDGPTTEPTDSPTPTAGTTPPASSSPAPSATPSRPDGTSPRTVPSSPTTSVPVAADTSTGELAYTGIDSGKLAAGMLIGLGLVGIGGAILAIRHRAFLARRRREAMQGDR